MLLSKLARALHIMSRLGLFSGIRYIFFKLVNIKGSKSFNTKAIGTPFKIRFHTTDVDVFEQIFVFEEYNLDYEIEPKLIIDAGANIGCASVYFANRFANATILSIEPEQNNFNVLMENTKYYRNINSFQAALWFEKTRLNLIDRRTGFYGFKVEPAFQPDGGVVETVTIVELLEKFDFTEIDILKMDIEGSEKFLFENYYEKWLSKVKILIIEIHDYITPGTSKSIFTALNNYNFELSQKGEYLVFRRID